MRFILTTIILTMLAQPAWAMSNEVLFKKCKPFAERGFELDWQQVVSMMGYVWGIS